MTGAGATGALRDPRAGSPGRFAAWPGSLDRCDRIHGSSPGGQEAIKLSVTFSADIWDGLGGPTIASANSRPRPKMRPSEKPRTGRRQGSLYLRVRRGFGSIWPESCKAFLSRNCVRRFAAKGRVLWRLSEDFPDGAKLRQNHWRTPTVPKHDCCALNAPMRCATAENGPLRAMVVRRDLRRRKMSSSRQANHY